MQKTIYDFLHSFDNQNIENLCSEPFHGVAVHIYWKDRSGKYLGCNELQAKNAGFESPNIMVNQTDNELGWVTPKTANQFKITNERIMQTQKAEFLIESAVLTDTTYIEAYSYKSPLVLNNKILGIKGVSILLEKKFAVIHPSLSSQQEECLYCLVQGMTIKQIARVMNLSPKTVEHYLEMIKNKLNCSSRYQLISAAIKMPCIKNRLLNN